MKTLAQLKRDIEIGSSILCLETKEANFNDPERVLVVRPLNEKMKKMRLVTLIDTTGFYLKSADDDSTKRGSFCGWPKASDLEYTEDKFTITERTPSGAIWQTRTYQLFKN